MSVVSIAAAFLLAAGLPAGGPSPSHAEQLKLELIPSPNNPATPRMGDALAFRAVIRNDGRMAVKGVIAWISLLETDPGKEQPVDLEDWSAQKAATLAGIAPGQSAETEWRLRLIQSGNYRIAVMAAATGDALDRNPGPVASPFAEFTVAAKPAVETGRVLPIASGVPLAIGAVLLWRGARGRRRAPAPREAGK